MKLEKIENATAATGVGYFKLTIDSKNYNFFGELGDISEGDNVECEFKKNGKYTNLVSVKKVMAHPSQSFEAKHDVVIQRVEKPNSFEFGPANKRHKIYYSDVSDLITQISNLEDAGLCNSSEFKNEFIPQAA